MPRPVMTSPHKNRVMPREAGSVCMRMLLHGYIQSMDSICSAWLDEVHAEPSWWAGIEIDIFESSNRADVYACLNAVIRPRFDTYLDPKRCKQSAVNRLTFHPDSEVPSN